MAHLIPMYGQEADPPEGGSAVKHPHVLRFIEGFFRLQGSSDRFVDKRIGREVVVPKVFERRVKPVCPAVRLFGNLP